MQLECGKHQFLNRVFSVHLRFVTVRGDVGVQLNLTPQRPSDLPLPHSVRDQSAGGQGSPRCGLGADR